MFILVKIQLMKGVAVLQSMYFNCVADVTEIECSTPVQEWHISTWNCISLYMHANTKRIWNFTSDSLGRLSLNRSRVIHQKQRTVDGAFTKKKYKNTQR